MILALDSYAVVMALHVIMVLAAYGLPLAYPMMLPYLRRTHPRAMPGVHDVQHRLNLMLTGPGTVLVLAFGLYMAAKHHLFGRSWVQVGITAIVIIALVGGWVLKASRRMSELARVDVAAAGPDGPVVWSAEYETLYRRYVRVEELLALVVVVTVFFMAAKP